MKTYNLLLDLKNLSLEQYLELEKVVNNLEFNEVIVEKIELREVENG